MDWSPIITRNRGLLTALVAALVAMAGWAAMPAPGTALLPRHVRNAILRLLRPAESAVRRLVFLAARGLVVDVPPSRPGRAAGRKPAPARRMDFVLLDPLKPFAWHRRRRSVPAHRAPRIIVFDRPPHRLPPPPGPDDPVNSARLALRLAAIGSALADIPREARRLAVIEARAAIARARDPGAPLQRRHMPLRRPGLPPGMRRRRPRPVDGILADCDAFAREAERDTG